MLSISIPPPLLRRGQGVVLKKITPVRSQSPPQRIFKIGMKRISLPLLRGGVKGKNKTKLVVSLLPPPQSPSL